MQNWQIAIIPPLLVWLGLFIYLNRIDRKVRELEERLRK